MEDWRPGLGALERKVAFITGVARGQGQAHAVRLAEEGADIIGIDICAPIASVEYELASSEDLAQTVKLVEDLGRRIVAREVDVRDASGMAAVLREGVSELGRLDIVIANAGILPICGEVADDDAAWRDALDVMLTGVYNTVRPAIPILLEQGQGGSIVITSSTAGLKGMASNQAGSLGYLAAKHGVVGLMRGWANILGPAGIRVNTVHPAGCNTPMVTNESFLRHVAQTTDDPGFKVQKVMPVDLIEPSDVANAVAFLVSDQGRYVTGQTFAVDAGFTVRV
jgi:SDR family mycofactocin-dependent oxidoreductase